MTHQTLSLEKYWKLFPATLRMLLMQLISIEKSGVEFSQEVIVLIVSYQPHTAFITF